MNNNDLLNNHEINLLIYELDIEKETNNCNKLYF